MDNAFSPFSFAVITDLHLSERQGMAQFDRFVEMVNRRADIDFVLCLGDLIWTDPMDELRDLTARISVPTHVVYGNNDWDRLAEYEATFGPRDRTFDHKGCLFVILWNCLPADSPHNHQGEVSAEQWQWLEDELAAARRRGVHHVFLASHVPPRCPNGYYEGFYLREETERRFWDLCERHEITACFFGHLHQDDVFDRHGTEIIITPSLNWNFLPPKREPDGPEALWEIADEGFSRMVQVHVDGISHALWPVDMAEAHHRPVA